jgi:competence protein ComEC
MINIENIRDTLQNKNFVMFLTSLIFIAGVSSYFYGPAILFASLVTVGLLTCLYLNLFSFKRVLFLIFVFYFGFFISFVKIKNYDDLLPLAPLNTTFTGRIVSIPNSPEKDKVRFFMQVDNVAGKNVAGKTFVTISTNPEVIELLNIGEKISINGNLRRPFSASNPSQFDYSVYLRNFNAFTVLYSNGEGLKFLEDKPSVKWKFLQRLNDTRNKILKTHSKFLKSPNLEILGGIVFGDDAVAPPDYIKTSFINSGLLHILAASGMNVAFIFSFWFVILRFLRVPYKPRVLSGMLLIVLYTLMTGLGPSVVRAALMLLFVLTGKLLDRDTHSVSLLSLVAVLMLIYNPAYLNNVSFQLSFLVTFGLITTATIFSQKLDKVPDWLKVPILIPLVAQIWIAPIQMFYFNTFSLYSIFANISTVCLLSVISFCGFVSSVISVITPLADITCKIFDFGLNYLLNILVWISDFFANLPHCVLQTTHPNLLQLLFYYSVLLTVIFLVKYEKYKESILVTIIGVVIILGTTIRPVSHKLEIIAFDVQNADSFLIKTPQNKYFFIDTGKAPYKSGNSQAKIIMLKYLKDRGIKDLEGVIVTHFDNDHSGGTVDFIENTNIKTLYLNSTEKETQTAMDIFNAVKKLKQNVRIVKNEDIIYFEPNLTLKTYKAKIGGKNRSNECSTVTLLSYGKFEMLFMGDAGVTSFSQLQKDIPHNVEVLKVGHHGGPRVVDSQMLEHLGNRVSLISTGINYFGHPNKGTLDILRNTDILRTDLLNSIKIMTDGNEYKIYSYDTHDKRYQFRENFYSK